MSIEAMEQALEALYWASDQTEPQQNDHCLCPICKGIDALRQAIAEAEKQETNHVTLTQTNIGIGERGMEAYEAAKERNVTTSRGWSGVSDERFMEMPEAEQEPVAWRFTGIAGFKKYITDTQYQSFHQDAKKWYEPYRCVNCTHPQPKAEKQEGQSNFCAQCEAFARELKGIKEKNT